MENFKDKTKQLFSDWAKDSHNEDYSKCPWEISPNYPAWEGWMVSSGVDAIDLKMGKSIHDLRSTKSHGACGQFAKG